jgi:5-methylcytosine-specific restriction endonuclease McrA
MKNPFESEKRRTLTLRERAKFFASRGGQCEGCGVKIRSGSVWDIDHILSLENGGTNDLDNLQLLCQNCHGAKTPKDRKQAATTKRKYTKAVVPNKHKRGGFRGWRKMNGDLVWRER